MEIKQTVTMPAAMRHLFVLLIVMLLGLNILVWNEPLVYIAFFVGSLIIMAGDLIYKKTVMQPLLLKPAYFFGIFFVLYFSIGCANISTYRGIVKPHTLLIITLGVLMFLIGVFIGDRIRVTRSDTTISFARLKIGMNTLLLISSSAAVYVVIRYGFIFLATYNKFYVNTHLLYCILLALVPSLIYFAYVQYNSLRVSIPGSLLYFGLPVLILITGGYRGYIILLMLMLGIIAYALSKNITRARLLIYVLIAVIMLNLGFYIMRDFNTYLTRTRELYAVHDFNKKYIAIAPVHFAFRETIGLFQRIMDVIPSRVDFGRGALLSADFLTILPGKQVAGGFLVKTLITGVNEVGGLTPSALGGLYFDFGYPGIFSGYFLMGMIAGLFYKIYVVNNDVQSIINLSFVYAVIMHYMHRGVLAPYYFFLFLIINIMFNIARLKKGGLFLQDAS